MQFDQFEVLTVNKIKIISRSPDTIQDLSRQQYQANYRECYA